MKNIKYLGLIAIVLSFTACNDEEDFKELLGTQEESNVVLPTLTKGSADFSTFVSLGNSLTAGFADGALYKVAQQNSTPSIMASQFALAGGGTFTQPLMSDNIGGLLAGGTPILNPMNGQNRFPPRLVFNGATPVPLSSVIGPVSSTTDLVLNNPTGPFNNMGVPGAKSFHLLAPGYGNLANLSLGLANPYFVRMTGGTPNASVLQLSMAQAPTFFSLWIGNNDVLGYALSGGDGSNPITPAAGPPGVGFDQSYGAIIATLTSNPNTKGIVANIPNVTSIPHFTTVPYNPIPLNEASAAALNQGYAQYNGGLLLAQQNGLITEDEVLKRTITFSEGEGNTMILIDEDLTDLSTSIGLPSFRQSAPTDLFVLPLASLIPQGYGTQIPLDDKWVITPEEQMAIQIATDGYNATIQAAATSAGLAILDANTLLAQLASVGIETSGYILNSSLVTGGAFSLDGVHPTSRGYALLANEMLKAIDNTYGSNFEASGNLVDVSSYNTNYSPLLLQ